MKIRCIIGLVITLSWMLLGFSCPLQAQTGESGVLLAKTYAWSPQNQIGSAYEFRSVVNHTGYYSVNPGPHEHQVQAALVVDIVYDNELMVKNIGSEADLAPLEAAQKRLEALSAASTEAQTTLASRLSAVRNEINYFRQGNVKIDGQWVSAAEASRRRELVKAAQEQARVDAQCDDLTQLLRRRDLTLERCEQAVEKLGTLHCHDADALQFIAQFQRDKATTASFKTDARAILLMTAKSPAVAAVASAKTAAQLQKLPPELTKTASDLEVRRLALERSVYPALSRQLNAEKEALSALGHLAAELVQVDAGDLRSAATEAAELDPTNRPHLVLDYPILAAAIENSRVVVRATSQEFTQCCARGSELEKLGKTAAAIEEYTKATDISKEPVILKKIQDLRNQTLGL